MHSSRLPPQILAKLAGAPDPKLDPDGYRGHLDKAQIARAFKAKAQACQQARAVTSVRGVRRIVSLSYRRPRVLTTFIDLGGVARLLHLRAHETT